MRTTRAIIDSTTPMNRKWRNPHLPRCTLARALDCGAEPAQQSHRRPNRHCNTTQTRATADFGAPQASPHERRWAGADRRRPACAVGEGEAVPLFGRRGVSDREHAVRRLVLFGEESLGTVSYASACSITSRTDDAPACQGACGDGFPCVSGGRSAGGATLTAASICFSLFPFIPFISADTS